MRASEMSKIYERLDALNRLIHARYEVEKLPRSIEKINLLSPEVDLVESAILNLKKVIAAREDELRKEIIERSKHKKPWNEIEVKQSFYGRKEEEK